MVMYILLGIVVVLVVPFIGLLLTIDKDMEGY
jgi:hypothetical protein